MSTELEMQKAMTLAFILADPTSVVLKRKEKVSDGSGGFKTDPASVVAPQTFRLIPQSDKVPEVATSDGKWAKLEYVVMGESDSDIRRYDIFEYKGRSYQIAQVHPDPSYEVKADAVIYNG